MKKTKALSEKEDHDNQIRYKAEAKLADMKPPQEIIGKPDELIHELRMHQIELEIQNEELKRAQIDLEKTNDRFIDLYDFAPVGYFTFFSNGLIEEVNLTGAALLGITRTKLIHRGFGKFVVPSDFNLWNEHLLKSVRNGEKQSCELRLKCEDGYTKFVRLESVRIEKMGGTRQIRTAVSDITQHKQEGEKLREIKNYLDTIIKSSYDGIFVVDGEGRFEFGNEAFFKMLDYPESELLGHSFMKVIHPNYHDFILKQWDELQKGEGKPYTIDIVRKDGTIRSLFVSHRGMELGGKRKYCLVAKDITKSKQAEEALRESEEKYRGLFEGSPDAIVIYVEGKVVFANEASVHLMRAGSLDQLLGRSVIEFVHPDYREFVNRRMTAARKDGKTLPLAEEIFLRFDGSAVDVEVKALPTTFENKPAVQVIVRDITERKRAEEALSESEALLSNAFNNSPLMMTISDLSTGKLLEVNDSFCTISGFNREEAIGKTSIEIGWLDEKGRKRMMQELQQHGKATGLELTLRNKSGKTVICRYSGEIIQTAQGNKLFSTAEDITEYKLAQEKLKNIRTLLSETAILGHVGGWELNIDTRKLTWTEETYKIHELELTYEPTVEKAINFYTPASRPIIEKAVSQAIENREPFDVELEIITAKGNLRSVHFIGKADMEKRIIYGFFQDITKSKNLDKLVKQSEESLKLAQRISQLGSWDWNIIKGTLSWSDEIYRQYDLKTNEITPSYEVWTKFIHPDDLDNVNRSVKEALEEEKPYSIDIRMISKKGRQFVIRTQGTVYKDENGKVVRFIGTQHDITQLKLKEEELRSSLDEKTILLHEVHHRVKNNLQIVSSLLSLQAMRIKNKEAIEALRETANRIQSMAMLHEALNRSGNMARVNFSTYINNICDHIIHSYGSKAEDVKLEKHIADIHIDLDQAVPCGLIINELVSNALKHAFPEGRKGRIIVELQKLPDDRLLLSVADDGTGLPSGIEIEQTETLGLKLVTILTEKLKGSVEIIRDPGTTFHIMFKETMNSEREL